MKKIFCTILSVIMLFANFNVDVMESNEIPNLEATIVETYNNVLSLQQRATTFDDASVNFSFSSEGLHIAIDTGTTMTASVIGVKDIKVQHKGLFGIWTTVATSDGAEAYNTSFVSIALTYTGAEVGENYRVVCTHYADVDGYRELEHETEMVTFNY